MSNERTVAETSVVNLEVAKLGRREFRQWKQARELELLEEDAPSRLGRLWKPARTERKLVLFTLGLIVFTLIVGTLVYAASEETPLDSILTSLTTLAGTGLGFIGGMVSQRNDDGVDKDLPDPA